MLEWSIKIGQKSFKNIKIFDIVYYSCDEEDVQKAEISWNAADTQQKLSGVNSIVWQNVAKNMNHSITEMRITPVQMRGMREREERQNSILAKRGNFFYNFFPHQMNHFIIWHNGNCPWEPEW